MCLEGNEKKILRRMELMTGERLDERKQTKLLPFESIGKLAVFFVP